MSTAVLSLGSNMADPMGQLTAAVRALGPLVRRVSSVYRTPPWGPVPQDDFLNLILIASTDGDPGAGDAAGDDDPMDWLRRCGDLERAARRERPVRWGPRTLDVDVVTVSVRRRGRDEPIVSDDAALTLPHPRAAQRAFVLLPWAEIDPDAELPGRGRVADLLAALDTSGIVRVGRVGT